jgi:hypothetical protein
MAALLSLVEGGEGGIRLFDPAARGLEDLARQNGAPSVERRPRRNVNCRQTALCATESEGDEDALDRRTWQMAQRAGGSLRSWASSKSGQPHPPSA